MEFLNKEDWHAELFAEKLDSATRHRLSILRWGVLNWVSYTTLTWREKTQDFTTSWICNERRF